LLSDISTGFRAAPAGFASFIAVGVSIRRSGICGRGGLDGAGGGFDGNVDGVGIGDDISGIVRSSIGAGATGGSLIAFMRGDVTSS